MTSTPRTKPASFPPFAPIASLLSRTKRVTADDAAAAQTAQRSSVASITSILPPSTDAIPIRDTQEIRYTFAVGLESSDIGVDRTGVLYLDQLGYTDKSGRDHLVSDLRRWLDSRDAFAELMAEWAFQRRSSEPPLTTFRNGYQQSAPAAHEPRLSGLDVRTVWLRRWYQSPRGASFARAVAGALQSEAEARAG